MNHKYIYALFLLTVIIFSAGVVFAQEETIELPGAGLTPKSAFYFLDRAGDWARLNVFTFNPVRKAEIKAEIAEERLSELNKVSTEDPERSDIIEKLETQIRQRTEEAAADTERLAGERDVSRPLEKLNNLSLKRQAVLEKAIERVPEQVREGIEKALENIHKQAEKQREVLLKQKEKGFISEEKAKNIIEKRLSGLKVQLERRRERAAQLVDEALKQRLENIIEKKTEALENEILDIESREEFKEAREKIKDIKKDVIQSVLETRKELKLKATTAEETLEQIRDDKLNLKERAEKLIKNGKERILATEKRIAELKENNIEIKDNVIVLFRNGKKHLEEAEAAFLESKYGEAFGRATATFRDLENIERAIQKITEMDKNNAEKERRLKECGPQPLAPGNWQCKDGKWQLQLQKEVIKPPVTPPEVKPENQICSQVITPARNIETKKCEIFRNSCLPKGWVRDESCGKSEIIDIIKPPVAPSEIKPVNPSVFPAKPSEESAESTKIINMIARRWSFNPDVIRVKQGEKVMLDIKSIDVTHGFSLPDFGVNAELKSGQSTKVEFTASKIGKFQFRCNVFCGAGHSQMAGSLIVE